MRALVNGITSLPREKATAAAVLQLVRRHWQIENRSHWIREVLLRKDDSHGNKKAIVQVLIAFRCAAPLSCTRNTNRAASGSAASTTVSLRTLGRL